MNKFSIRAIPAAVALTATLAFAAHAQVGVRTGTNTNISADVRANAGSGASVNSNTNASVNTNASANSDGTVKRAVRKTGNAVQRTGNKVEGAVGNAADATRDGSYRAKNAVGGVAARADGAIQRNLPGNNNAGAPPQVNVQGSGNVSAGGGVQRPPQ
jgi:hypothetical protein